jgi:hypothetical protein
VGNSTFVKFAKAPQVTPDGCAILRAILLELNSGQRKQSQMCCSARESLFLYNVFFAEKNLYNPTLKA